MFLKEKTLNILEYNIILQRLSELTSGEMAGQTALALKPMTDIDSISEALRQTEDASLLIIRKGLPPLGGIKDLRPALIRACTGATLSFKELLGIAGLWKCCRRLLNYSASVEDNFDNTVSSMIALLTENRAAEERIYRCILSEEEMSDEASPLLKEIRRQINEKQNSIKDKLNSLIHSSSLSKAIQEPVITVRGNRYCIPVKIEYRSEFQGIVHDTSSSGQTLFIEPAFVVEANNKIRELRVKEADEIERIASELSAEVGANEYILRQNMDLVAKIDFSFAKARLALDMKAVNPILNDRGIINIINGRHPMIDKNKVVPISFNIGRDYSTVVITGPNTGGKTVALKTVGLFTVMAQSGLMIPADEKTEIAVFKGVYADIGDEQSIAQSLSTFSAHMKNIVEILQNCDSDSLVLFDELGAGTDPTEGAALAMSILECVHQTGVTTVATTHYSELKVFAATTKGFANASCEFDVSTLKPTYKLLIGVPGKSNAFAISQKLGLDPQLVDRAKEFLSQEDLRFEDMLFGIEKSRQQMESDREETQRLREESKNLQDKIIEEMDLFNEKKNEILEKTREEARVILNKARIASDKILSELRKAQAMNSSEALRNAEKAKKEFSDIQKETVGDLYRDKDQDDIHYSGDLPPQNVLPGQEVRIISLKTNATVLKSPDKDGKVYLQAGIMKMTAPLSDIRILKEKNTANDNKGKVNVSGGNTFMKASTIKSELDIRGMTVDEGITLIDRQIHDGLLAKQSQFSIIHGKGTGALRKGVHKYLKSCKFVKDFRLGEFGEGDAGVTIVFLL